MTYKEVFFFIAKCLTISHEEINKKIVESRIKNQTVDWELVTKISTKHYVLCALYCNFKRNKLLKYIPDDMVNYMSYITNLNKKRNFKILQQVGDINRLLISHDVNPIFIKGSGNIIEGLYLNISERMIGDIDFICSKENYEKSINLLKENGYSLVSNEKNIFPEFKHYHRMIKKDGVAAVEIHKELTIEKYCDEFNYNIIKDNIQNINKIRVLGFEDQFYLSIMSNQIDDNGFEYKYLALKNAYDAFLLSKKFKTDELFLIFKKLKNPLNCFLTVANYSFGKIRRIPYIKTAETDKYLSRFLSLISNKKMRESNYKIRSKIIYIKMVLNFIFRAFYIKENRLYLQKRVFNKNWFVEKLNKILKKK